MSEQTTNPLRAARVNLANTDLAQITVITGESALEQQQVEARLLDLSLTGAKIELRKEVALAKNLRIKFALADLGMEFYVSAAICWVKPAAGGLWQLGCAFEPPMPESIFKHLASHGTVERREAPRRHPAEQIAMQVEYDLRQAKVNLLNHSPGGFCFNSPESIAPGTQMILSLPQQSFRLPAQAQWQVATGEGYLIGCAYGEKRGYQQLHQQCPQEAVAV